MSNEEPRPDPPRLEDYGATRKLYKQDYEAYLDKYRDYKRAFYQWVRENDVDLGDCSC